MNAFDQMEIAMSEARAAMAAADKCANQMARMLRGRLSNVDGYVLNQLKHELRDWNMHTKEWKGQK